MLFTGVNSTTEKKLLYIMQMVCGFRIKVTKQAAKTLVGNYIISYIITFEPKTLAGHPKYQKTRIVA